MTTPDDYRRNWEDDEFPWHWSVRLLIVVFVIAIPWALIISGLHWIGLLG